MDKPRVAYARVIYDGLDITDELNPLLLSLKYTDSLDEGDDINFQFIDDEAGANG